MADASIIQELLRQDFQKKQQQQVQPQQDMQSMIQSIMQGIQIYDAVKGLGTKYDKPGTPAKAAQPAMPPLGMQGSPMGSQITPMQGFPVPGAQPGMSPTGMPMGGAGAPPPGNLQALLATLQPQAGTPAQPAIPAGPPIAGSTTIEQMKGMQNFPDFAKAQMAARGYGDIGNVIPEQKLLQTATIADNKNSTAIEIGAGHDAAKVKAAGVAGTNKKTSAAETADEKLFSDYNKVFEKKGSNTRTEVLQQLINIGKKLKKDTAVYESVLSKKLPPPGASRIAVKRKSDGKTGTVLESDFNGSLYEKIQ